MPCAKQGLQTPRKTSTVGTSYGLSQTRSLCELLGSAEIVERGRSPVNTANGHRAENTATSKPASPVDSLGGEHVGRRFTPRLASPSLSLRGIGQDATGASPDQRTWPALPPLLDQGQSNNPGGRGRRPQDDLQSLQSSKD